MGRGGGVQDCFRRITRDAHRGGETCLLKLGEGVKLVAYAAVDA